ncbi:hypothetical protein FWD20_03935 [Candidatus Saccharibacteria bacterium]|nr:hypothetical protein [Candidatus Saccharibacteria bacterium]
MISNLSLTVVGENLQNPPLRLPTGFDPGGSIRAETDALPSPSDGGNYLAPELADAPVGIDPYTYSFGDQAPVSSNSDQGVVSLVDDYNGNGREATCCSLDGWGEEARTATLEPGSIFREPESYYPETDNVSPFPDLGGNSAERRPPRFRRRAGAVLAGFAVFFGGNVLGVTTDSSEAHAVTPKASVSDVVASKKPKYICDEEEQGVFYAPGSPNVKTRSAIARRAFNNGWFSDPNGCRFAVYSLFNKKDPDRQSTLYLKKGTKYALKSNNVLPHGTIPGLISMKEAESKQVNPQCKSSNKKVVEVKGKCTLTAKRAGHATITASSHNERARVSVKVVNKRKPVSNIKTARATVPETVLPCSKATAKVKWSPANMTNVKPKFSSSDPETVYIDPNTGQMKTGSYNAGPVTITVKVGRLSTRHVVTVGNYGPSCLWEERK